MDTRTWMEILLLSNVLIGWVFYSFGHAMGKEQQKKDSRYRRVTKHRAEREAAKARHPAGSKLKKLKLVKDE